MRPLVRLGIRRRTTHAAHRLVTPLVVSRGSYATPPLEQLIINSSDWKSDNHYHRLGFHEEVRDTGRIKEHYRVLAKHFHPDSPTAPPDATEAFQNIKESYEYVLGAASNESSGRSQSEARSAFRFYDHERRQGQVRLLGEGVALFMVMTIGFILLVSRHNNSRLQARYLAHLVVIFFVIQLFPRLLAAAILYACHSNYLVNIAELTEQATASILFERRDEELFIRLEGVWRISVRMLSFK
ncbi:DnaJ domain [Trypanosoma vivax]|nr:DnaJ domain [Trypanosoma vivax]